MAFWLMTMLSVRITKASILMYALRRSDILVDGKLLLCAVLERHCLIFQLKGTEYRAYPGHQAVAMV